MARALVFLALTCALAFAVACGDDDAPDTSRTTTPTGTAGTATVTQGASTDTPAETDPGKTEPPSETGNSQETPAPTAPGEVPTPPPTASEGRPAIQPADESAFLASIQGIEFEYVTCAYNPSTAGTNCPGHGLFRIDPPIVGQDITCQLWVDAGNPRVIQCISAEPAQTKYYEVQ